MAADTSDGGVSTDLVAVVVGGVCGLVIVVLVIVLLCLLVAKRRRKRGKKDEATDNVSRWIDNNKMAALHTTPDYSGGHMEGGAEEPKEQVRAGQACKTGKGVSFAVYI